MIKMTLKEAAYITVSGYGPNSNHTLEEWLYARDLFRKNQKAALSQISIPKEVIK
jgi:hypothetical protein